MSRSTYYFFGQDGQPLHNRTITTSNAFGSVPVIWDYMCRKYVSPNSVWLVDIMKFWEDAILQAKLSVDDRFLLAVTGDQVLTPREEFGRLAELLRALPKGDLTRVSHWPDIADVLVALSDDETILGMGMAQSNSSNLWQDPSGWIDARTAIRVSYNGTKTTTVHFRDTDRGFTRAEFTDRYGVKCSIQESSLATEKAIWLGVDAPEPRILASDAARLELPTDGKTTGWVPYTMPKEVLCNTRMHLTRGQAGELAEILEHFAKTGKLRNGTEIPA